MPRRAQRIGIAALAICISGVVAANVFPDRTYSAYSESRRWIDAAVHLQKLTFPRPAPPPFEIYTDSAGYSVFTAWIEHWARQRQITIQAETEGDTRQASTSCFPEAVRSEFAEAFIDFSAQNRLHRPRLLERRFGSHLNYSLVSKAGTPAVSEYFTLSAIGLSRDGTKAVLYVVHPYAWGRYFLFRKSGTQWISIDAPFCGWIS